MSVTEVGRYVEHTAGTATGSVTPTSSIPVGHTLVAFGNCPASTAATAFAFSDAQSNTWTTRQTETDTPGARQMIVGTCVVTTEISGDITLSSNSNPQFWAVVVLDLGAVGDVDVSAKIDTATATSSTPSLTTGTAGADHQWVLAAFGYSNSARTYTAGTGFTGLTDARINTSPFINMAVEYAEVDTSGTRTAGITFNTAGSYSAVMVAVNADAPTPPAPVHTVFRLDGTTSEPVLTPVDITPLTS